MAPRARAKAAAGGGKKTRKAGMLTVGTRKSKLGGQFGKLLKETETLQNDRDLDDIIKELKSNPEKIKGCKAAVLSTFLVGGQEPNGTEFNNCYVYLYKLPKEWLTGVLLPAFVPSLSELEWKMHNKVDKQIAHKIMYVLTATDKATWTPSMNKAECQRLLAERFRKYGPERFKFVEDAVGRCDWNKCGLFRFVPEMPGEVRPGDHRYTHISFQGRVSLDLASFPMPITGDWKIEDNWSINKAKLKAPSRVTFSKNLAEAFAEARKALVDEARTTWQMKSVAQLPGQPLEAQQAVGPDAAEEQEGENVRAAPKRKTMSNRQRVALAAAAALGP